MEKSVKKRKKVQRSVYMSQETWDYIDSICQVGLRKPNQEIEFIILMTKARREKGDAEAVKLAVEHIPHPETPQ